MGNGPNSHEEFCHLALLRKEPEHSSDGRESSFVIGLRSGVFGGKH